MLTIEALLEEVGLELVCGREAARRPVRWVHITELPDPTPWLSGGELLLTTGMQLTTPQRQRAFVRRLAEHGLAGLGLGTGFEHPSLPAALVGEARALGFPVFEVPYAVPFIALTERAYSRLVNEHYAVLQRGLATHRRLERLLVEERGLQPVLDALAEVIGGSVAVLGPRADAVVASAPGWDAELLAEVRESVAAAASLDGALEPMGGEGRVLVLPVMTRGPAPRAWLAARLQAGPPGDFERLILQQAATVVALELLRQRTARDAERRIAGQVLSSALAGNVAREEVERSLRRFGLESPGAVLVFALADPEEVEPVLDRFLAEAGVGALVAAHEGSLCAVVDGGVDDPVEVAARARAALEQDAGPVRVGVGSAGGERTLRRGYHEARCALEATALRNGDAPAVATHEDLGSYWLLLSLQDDDALRAYSDEVLGPLERDEPGYGRELLRSVEAFIEHNGHWERAAQQLFCHRHTLRYRIRRVEDLTGRSLGRAQDRIELWLALRARELVA